MFPRWRTSWTKRVSLTSAFRARQSISSIEQRKTKSWLVQRGREGDCRGMQMWNTQRCRACDSTGLCRDVWLGHGWLCDYGFNFFPISLSESQYMRRGQQKPRDAKWALDPNVDWLAGVFWPSRLLRVHIVRLLLTRKQRHSLGWGREAVTEQHNFKLEREIERNNVENENAMILYGVQA